MQEPPQNLDPSGPAADPVLVGEVLASIARKVRARYRAAETVTSMAATSAVLQAIAELQRQRGEIPTTIPGIVQLPGDRQLMFGEFHAVFHELRLDYSAVREFDPAGREAYAAVLDAILELQADFPLM